MIQFCSRQEAIRRMNQWGGESSPFLFLIDYAQETCLVERLEEIDPQEIQFNLNGSTNQPEGWTQILHSKGASAVVSEDEQRGRVKCLPILAL